MAGSTLGTLFKITTWGESHGKGVGVVIDGCPAGLSLCEADIQKFLDRRKPGQSRYATPRKEDDAVEILSGVFEGKTTGTPISLVVFNRNQQSKDYSEIAVPVTPITRSTRNTASATTAGAGAPPGGKPSGVSPPAPSPSRF